MLRWIFSCAILLSSVAGKKKRSRITLVAPGLPCSFGPYQRQLLILASQFQKRGRNVEWLAVHEEIPMGRHRWRDLGEQSIMACTKMYGSSVLDVLQGMTYLGFTKETIFPGGPIAVSYMNKVLKRYNVKKMLMLMDVDAWIKNTDQFEPTTIFWLPYHYERLLNQDRFFLESVHAVAALTPSFAKELKQTMGEDVHITNIPHIIEKNKYYDTKRSRVRKELGIPKNKFVVLMQGGNYEPTDRKGWFMGLQAYARFVALHPEVDAHLYIHAPSSVTIAAMDHAEPAPPHLAKRGVPLHTYLKRLGIGKRDFTFIDGIYSQDWVAKRKRAANVCLHPSKTEGFGMHVLECQLAGAPVITTNYTAMADVTKYGVSVSPRQLEWMVNGDVATPDVQGLVDALTDVWSKKFVPELTRSAAKRFIRSNYNAESIAKKFLKLFSTAQRAKKKIVKPPAYTVSLTNPIDFYVSSDWILYVPDRYTIMDFESLDKLLSTIKKRAPRESSMLENLAAIVLPVSVGGTKKLLVKDDEMRWLHRAVPVLVRTQMFYGALLKTDVMYEIVHTILSHASKSVHVLSRPVAYINLTSTSSRRKRVKPKKEL